MLEWASYDNLVLALSFAFCLSLTAGGILVVFRAEQARHALAWRYLQYFLVSLYTFGFYSLWSDILIPEFLGSTGGARLTAIVAEMGVPFFAISLIMEVTWANRTRR